MPSIKNLSLYTHLNEEQLNDPLAVIRDFGDWSDLRAVKKQLWEWLMTALSAPYAGYEEAGKRWELLFLYQRLAELIEASYVVGENGNEDMFASFNSSTGDERIATQRC